MGWFPNLVGSKKANPLAEVSSRPPRHILWRALNGAFATDDSSAYLEAWQSVDSDEGVPLAVANRVFGKDALKPIIEELNEVLVA